MTFREWCVAACLLMAGLSAEFELVPLPARMGGAAELLHFGGTLENCTHSDKSDSIACAELDPGSRIRCHESYQTAVGSQLWLDVLGVNEIVCTDTNCVNNRGPQRYDCVQRTEESEWWQWQSLGRITCVSR